MSFFKCIIGATLISLCGFSLLSLCSVALAGSVSLAGMSSEDTWFKAYEKYGYNQTFETLIEMRLMQMPLLLMLLFFSFFSFIVETLKRSKFSFVKI